MHGAAVLLIASQIAVGAPPRVIRATPDHGDTHVPFSLSEIVIEFDQDMSTKSWSICGGGPRFPKTGGKPTWRGPRTLVCPVNLEAGHDYALSINCPAALGFRSAGGEPAVIHPIQFRTVAEGEAAPPSLTPEQNREAIDKLKQAIAQTYSYVDLRVKDWEAVFDSIREPAEHASTPAEFARVCASALEGADDLHLNLRVGPYWFATSHTAPQANWDMKQIQRSVPGFAWKSEFVASGKFADGVGYILITSWPGDLAATRPAHDALADLATAPAIIVDVRPNGGGDELAARAFASRFVQARCVYSRSDFRDADAPSGFGEMRDRTIEPSVDEPRYAGAVAVLIGPAVVSSCESFVLMMNCSERATLVGATTRGSSGNPRPVDLGNGVTAMIPTWRDFLPDGTLLEGHGIEPELSALPGDPGGPDGVIAAAHTAVLAASH